MAVWWKRWCWVVALVACVVMAAVFTCAPDGVESDHLPLQDGQCERLEWDHDHNCVIGASDLGHVAAHFGTKAPTWTPTPITLTPTPPSNLSLIETIIRDSDEQTPHDVIPCVPASYDWGRTSAVQGVGPAGYNAGDAWGVFQPLGCTSAQGIQVSIRNVRGYAYNGAWHLVNTGSAWCAAMNYETNVIMESCSGGAGPNWTMPQQSLHWAGPIAAIPSGTTCALTHFEARASGAVLAGGGWDWRRTSNPGDIRAGGVGRYHLIGSEWEPIGFSTCPEAVVRTFSP